MAGTVAVHGCAWLISEGEICVSAVGSVLRVWTGERDRAAA